MLVRQSMVMQKKLRKAISYVSRIQYIKLEGKAAKVSLDVHLLKCFRTIPGVGSDVGVSSMYGRRLFISIFVCGRTPNSWTAIWRSHSILWPCIDTYSSYIACQRSFNMRYALSGHAE